MKTKFATAEEYATEYKRIDEKIIRIYAQHLKEGETYGDRDALYRKLREEQYFYSPFVSISLLDIIPFLPIQLETTKENSITHITLHKRKKWGEGELVVFHKNNEVKGVTPHLRCPNTFKDLSRTIISIPRIEAIRIGLEEGDYRKRESNIDDTRRAVDIRPVIIQYVSDADHE